MPNADPEPAASSESDFETVVQRISSLTVENDDLDDVDLDSATSIIGGQAVEGRDEERRVFNFSLPFSSPLQGKFHFKGFTLNTLKKPTPVVPEVDTYWESDEEDMVYNTKYLNPRKHALKSALFPHLGQQVRLPCIKGNVVILGGYRGSTLRDQQANRMVWIPFKVGLRMRKINLALGTSDEDELLAQESIYADGVLNRIGPVDVCRKLMMQLREQAECNLVEFGYDWRLSCDINSAKLYDLLEALQRDDPDGQGAIVIAHSMGGLIAHHALQRCVKGHKGYVRGIVYAGSPSECQPILGPMRNGEAVMFAKDILTPKVNFLMRSSFVFLPQSGRCFVDKTDLNHEYPLDFYDVETWIEHELSPCVSKNLATRLKQNGPEPSDDELLDYDEAVEYLRRTLKRTKKFHQELERLEGYNYPPMAVIYGNALPACRGCKVDSWEDINTTTYESLWYGAGDGVVYRRHLAPIAYGFPEVPTFPSKNGHISLLSDLEAVAQALTVIVGEDTSGSSHANSFTERISRSKTRFLNASSLAGLSRSRSRSKASRTPSINSE